MAAVNRGFGATIGIGIESSWGTAVARTNWLRAAAINMKRSREKVMVPHLGSLGQASTNYRHFFVQEDFAGGSFEIPMAYDDSTVLLLRSLLGANTTTGAGPYTHTMTLASPNPFALTLETIYGTPASGGGNMAEVFEGCILGGGTISVENGGLMMLEANVIAETSGGNAAAGSPTYSSNGEYVRHNQLTTATYNSTTRAIKSLRINVDRGLQRNQELGSLLTQQPVEDRLKIDVELSMLWQSADWKDEWLNDTQSDLVVAFTGSGQNLMTFTMHNLLIKDVSDPVTTAAGIQRTISACALADGSDQGLSIAARNSNALATAN